MQMNYKILIILILVFGAGLRFHHLDQESLWTDEMFSIKHTESNLIDSVIQDELTPPGYFILLNQWIKLGNSEFTLRSLSVIFDILSILLIYLLGSIYNKKIGIIASIIYATTMIPIVYAQEARGFAMFTFLALLSTYIFIKILNQKEDTYHFLLYTLVNLLALYTNYLAIFILAAHSIYLLTQRRDLKEHIASYLLTAIFFLPGIKILYQQTLLRQTALQGAFAIRNMPNFFGMNILILILPVILLSIILLALYLLSKKIKIKQQHNKLLAIILILAAILLHFFIFDLTLRSFAWIRYSLFLLPFAIILITKTLSKSKLLTSLLILILILNSISLYTYYQTPTKPEWKNAVNYIEENSENPLILFERAGSNVNIYKYYSTKPHTSMNLTTRVNDEYIQIEDKELENLENFWLVSSRVLFNKEHYKNLLNKNYNLELQKEFKDIELYYYN